MGKMIKVKVSPDLREFTYKNKKGYHTVVGNGEVPSDNQEVKEALEKGWIKEEKTQTKTSFNFQKKRKEKSEDSPSKK